MVTCVLNSSYIAVFCSIVIEDIDSRCQDYGIDISKI